MSTVSTAFTAVGVGTSLRVRAKESFTFVITNTFVGTWQVQKEVGGGGAWEVVASGTTTQALTTLTNNTYEDANYRLACSAFTSGTITTVLADVEGDLLKMPAAGANAVLQNGNGDTVFRATESGVYTRQKPVVIAASTTITPELHANRTILFDIASGATATLPAATGTGDKYEFVILTAVTTNAAIIKVANATDTMVGLILGLDDDGVPANAWTVGGTNDTVNMDGSTQGGLAGDRVIVQDIAAGKFLVNGFIKQTGTEATPMAATV